MQIQLKPNMHGVWYRVRWNGKKIISALTRISRCLNCFNALHSCGIQGPADWKKIFNNKTLPSTCCHLIPEGFKNCTAQYASQDGCLPKLLNFLDSKSLLLGVAGIGIAIVQLIGVIFACALSKAFREHYETV